MNYDHLDQIAIQKAKAGVPTGYILSNGVTVVWGSPNGRE